MLFSCFPFPFFVIVVIWIGIAHLTVVCWNHTLVCLAGFPNGTAARIMLSMFSRARRKLMPATKVLILPLAILWGLHCGYFWNMNEFSHGGNESQKSRGFNTNLTHSFLHDYAKNNDNHGLNSLFDQVCNRGVQRRMELIIFMSKALDYLSLKHKLSWSSGYFNYTDYSIDRYQVKITIFYSDILHNQTVKCHFHD